MQSTQTMLTMLIKTQRDGRERVDHLNGHSNYFVRLLFPCLFEPVTDLNWTLFAPRNQTTIKHNPNCDLTIAGFGTNFRAENLNKKLMKSNIFGQAHH